MVQSPMGTAKGVQIEHIGGIYSLGRKLGSGSFGDAFCVSNTRTGDLLAAKIESAKASNQMLHYEAKVLRHLQGAPGIASLHYYGEEEDYNVMVMDLLGPSLECLFNMCGRRFSLKTVLMIADQLLYRIEYLHSRSYVHRDIKPDNCLIGSEDRSNLVYIIDFGLAKRYQDPKSKQHLPFREKKGLTGTVRYASINAHSGIEQSRRDDLEAIGYVLIYFLRGQLPWQGIKADTKEERHQQILEKKRATSVDELCKGFPPAFSSYLHYCMSLRFEDRPDYAYLRRRFKEAFLRGGFANDGMFDWSRPAISSDQAGGTPANVGAAAAAGGAGGDAPSPGLASGRRPPSESRVVRVASTLLPSTCNHQPSAGAAAPVAGPKADGRSSLPERAAPVAGPKADGCSSLPESIAELESSMQPSAPCGRKDGRTALPEQQGVAAEDEKNGSKQKRGLRFSPFSCFSTRRVKK